MAQVDRSISRPLTTSVERIAGLERAERIAYWLDDAFRIPFTNFRVGLDPLLGTVPWLGDTMTALLSIYLIGNGVYYQLPKIVVLRMALNVVVDYALGFLPFVGDATDFVVKSNRRNLRLLREYAGTRTQPRLSDWLFVGGVIGGLLLLVGAGIFGMLWVLQKVFQQLPPFGF